MLEYAGVLLDGFSQDHVSDLNRVVYLLVPIRFRELSARNRLLRRPDGKYEAGSNNQRRAQPLEIDLPVVTAYLHEGSIGEQKANLIHKRSLPNAFPLIQTSLGP